MYGHIERMATEVCAGVESSGCDCRLFQIAETLPAEVLTKMHAKEKNRQIPFIKAEQLPEADGILFGMPTRFGSAPTQVRALFDQCGAHWMSDALFGKPVICYFPSLSFPPFIVMIYFRLRLAFSFPQAHLVVVKRPQRSPV